MAGYGYNGRGYPNNNGVEQRTNECNKTSYDGNGHSDHVCRPVIIDAEGRKRPIISYTPSHDTPSYVTKTETLVEQVYAPVRSEYEYSSPTKDYGVVNNKWGRPSSPVRDRPQKVEELITQVQTEVSRPTRIGPLGATFWRQTPNSTGNYGNTGYDEYNNVSSNEWNKPTGRTSWGKDMDPDDYRRATMTLPNRGAPLTSPTSDISTALENLKREAAKFSSVNAAGPKPRFIVSVPGGPKRDTYTETFESREAPRRYGSFNGSSRPSAAPDTYYTNY